MEVRAARLDDDAELGRIDGATWESGSPSPRPVGPRPFFGERTPTEDVLVAADGDAPAGYVKLARPTPVPANAHVLQITGLAVDPARQGGGIGLALVEAAVQEARRRGARRLTLRVLASNAPARALYARCGFVEEGVLREEFLLGGRFVDDVLMARDLTR